MKTKPVVLKHLMETNFSSSTQILIHDILLDTNTRTRLNVKSWSLLVDCYQLAQTMGKVVRENDDDNLPETILHSSPPNKSLINDPWR